MIFATGKRAWGWLLVLSLALAGLGCGGGPRTGTTDPEAKLRLQKLMDLYWAYVEKKNKTPANEKDLKDFVQGMSPRDKDSLSVPDDYEKLFTSPRDGQKYMVRYGIPKPERGGESRALAWEQAGAEGKRFVALSVGYVEEYGEESFKDLK